MSRWRSYATGRSWNDGTVWGSGICWTRGSLVGWLVHRTDEGPEQQGPSAIGAVLVTHCGLRNSIVPYSFAYLQKRGAKPLRHQSGRRRTRRLPKRVSLWRAAKHLDECFRGQGTCIMENRLLSCTRPLCHGASGHKGEQRDARPFNPAHEKGSERRRQTALRGNTDCCVRPCC